MALSRGFRTKVAFILDNVLTLLIHTFADLQDSEDLPKNCDACIHKSDMLLSVQRLSILSVFEL